MGRGRPTHTYVICNGFREGCPMSHVRTCATSLGAAFVTLLVGSQSIGCGAEATEEEATASAEALDQSLYQAAAAAGLREAADVAPEDLVGAYDPNGVP